MDHHHDHQEPEPRREGPPPPHPYPHVHSWRERAVLSAFAMALAGGVIRFIEIVRQCAAAFLEYVS